MNWFISGRFIPFGIYQILISAIKEEMATFWYTNFPQTCSILSGLRTHRFLFGVGYLTDRPLLMEFTLLLAPSCIVVNGQKSQKWSQILILDARTMGEAEALLKLRQHAILRAAAQGTESLPPTCALAYSASHGCRVSVCLTAGIPRQVL